MPEAAMIEQRAALDALYMRHQPRIGGIQHRQISVPIADHLELVAVIGFFIAVPVQVFRRQVEHRGNRRMTDEIRRLITGQLDHPVVWLRIRLHDIQQRQSDIAGQHHLGTGGTQQGSGQRAGRALALGAGDDNGLVVAVLGKPHRGARNEASAAKMRPFHRPRVAIGADTRRLDHDLVRPEGASLNLLGHHLDLGITREIPGRGLFRRQDDADLLFREDRAQEAQSRLTLLAKTPDGDLAQNESFEADMHDRWRGKRCRDDAGASVKLHWLSHRA